MIQNPFKRDDELFRPLSAAKNSPRKTSWFAPPTLGTMLDAPFRGASREGGGGSFKNGDTPNPILGECR